MDIREQVPTAETSSCVPGQYQDSPASMPRLETSYVQLLKDLELAVETPLPSEIYDELLYEPTAVEPTRLMAYDDRCHDSNLPTAYVPDEWYISQRPWMYDIDGNPAVNSWQAHQLEWLEPLSPQRTFHGFCNLPQELRDLIWKLHLPDPRILILLASDYDENDSHDSVYRDSTLNVWFEPDTFDDGSFREISMTMLLVSDEARKVYQDNYQCLQLLGPNISGLWGEDTLEFSDLRRVPHISFRSIPFDCKRDTILLTSANVEELNDRGCRLNSTSIRHLMVLKSIPRHYLRQSPGLFPTPELVANFSKGFPNLETLSVVIGSERISKGHSGYKSEVVDRFFEVAEKFATILVEDFSYESYPRRRQRNHKLISIRYEAEAKLWRQGLRNLIETEQQYKQGSKLKVQVLMQSSIYGDPQPAPKRINLVPVDPRFSGITFFTEKPMVAFSPPPPGLSVSEGSRYLYIPTLHCYAYCLPNGDPLLDGAYIEDIRYLFDD